VRKEGIGKKELAAIVYHAKQTEEMRLTRKEVDIMMDIFLDAVKESLGHLKTGERMELRGLGSFVAKERKPRTARNPKTGETVKVPKRRTITFKVGREIKIAINAKKK
jgi:nucleoid DNA-binding protein